MLAFNVAANDRSTDGFSRDITTGDHSGEIHRYNVRAKLLYKPSGDFSVLLGFERTGSTDSNAVAYNSYQGLNEANVIVGPGQPAIVIPTQRGETSSDYPNKISGWGG